MGTKETFDYNLAKEFEIYKLIHKTTVVEAKLRCIYKDLANTGTTIPDFMQESPEKRAKKHLLELLNNRENFEKIYNSVWEEIKYALP